MTRIAHGPNGISSDLRLRVGDGIRIMVTNYIGIYMVGGDDGKVGRKYEILSDITYVLDNQ